MTDAGSELPAVPATLDWRAIAFGAGATLAVGMLGPYLLLQVLSKGSGMIDDPRWFALWPLIGLLADGVGGALAGLLARRRGATHGVIASALAFVGGLVVSIGRLVNDGHAQMLLSLGYWGQVIAWTVAGLGVAAVAGLVAARTAAAATATPRE